MKKILLAENSDKAETFISELENSYLPAVRSVNIGINALGIDVPDKTFLCEVINGNYDRLREEYWKIVSTDIDSFKSVSGREQMKVTAERSLESFIKTIPGMFTPTFQDGSGRLMNDVSLQQYFEINESGPFVTDAARDQIAESFREYISGTKVSKVYEAQSTLAKDLQVFVDAIIDSKMDRRGLLLSFPWQFIGSCFEIEAIRDETETEIVAIKINPGQLNYNKE